MSERPRGIRIVDLAAPALTGIQRAAMAGAAEHLQPDPA